MNDMDMRHRTQANVTDLTHSEQRQVAAAIDDARSAATRRAYASRWRQFESWCHDIHRQPLPADPAHVAAFLVELADAGKALSTINTTTAAIRARHEDAGFDDPTVPVGVRRTRAGLARRLGQAPTQQAHPISLAELRRMLAVCAQDSPRALRDRALLLLGYAAALRRSELAALSVSDISRAPGGISVRIRHSKSDQQGHGQLVGVTRGTHHETCPVTALHTLNALVPAAAIRSSAVSADTTQCRQNSNR